MHKKTHKPLDVFLWRTLADIPIFILLFMILALYINIISFLEFKVTHFYLPISKELNHKVTNFMC